MKLTLALMAITISTLIGCAVNQEKPQAQFVANLCDFKHSQPHIIISHIAIHGEVMQGDFVNKTESGYKKIASVLAVTKDNVLRPPREGWGECCQWVPGYFPKYYCGYQYCRGIEGYSLTGVLGLARAPDMEQAENMALENCKTALQQFGHEVGSNPSQPALQCKIQKLEWCD